MAGSSRCSAVSNSRVAKRLTFPEYLDVLDPRQFTMDAGTQVPHGALRNYRYNQVWRGRLT